MNELELLWTEVEGAYETRNLIWIVPRANPREVHVIPKADMNQPEQHRYLRQQLVERRLLKKMVFIFWKPSGV